MERRLIVGYQSAVAYWRATRVASPDRDESEFGNKVIGALPLSSAEQIERAMNLCCAEEPLDVVCPTRLDRRNSKRVVNHSWKGPLTRDRTLALGNGIEVCRMPAVFSQLATDLDEISLAQIAGEMAGNYVVDLGEEEGMVGDLAPLVTISLIALGYQAVSDNALVKRLLLGMQAGVAAVIFAVVLALVLAYGYWEQQGLFVPKYEEVQTMWYQDQAFMEEVEEVTEAEDVIFQLPYMKNFENGSVNNMWDYTQLRAPLHSDKLRFSYGAGYGTENDVWYRETSELPPDEMVAELRAQGVAGIYLNLDGYAVEDQQQTLADLMEAAGCSEDDVIEHESGMIYYIPLE